MSHEGVTGVQRQPQVLAATASTYEHAAPQLVGEGRGTGEVAAHGPGVQDLDGDDPRAENVTLEAGADDLDLGELRHLRIL
jgi:hypothetical protein